MTRPATLAEVHRRVTAGEAPYDHALPEFLDALYLADAARRQAMLDVAPPPWPSSVHHAFFGAIGEHLALCWGGRVPAWTNDATRVLKRPYFDELTALYLAQCPTAFRRRLIFTEAEPLRRARMPRAA